MPSFSRRAAAVLQGGEDFRTGQLPGEGSVRVNRTGASSQGQPVLEGLGREIPGPVHRFRHRGALGQAGSDS